MRKLYRQIAKARMTKAGIGNVNKKLARRDAKGNVFWREIIFGKYAKETEALQIVNKAKTRKIKKLERSLAHV